MLALAAVLGSTFVMLATGLYLSIAAAQEAAPQSFEAADSSEPSLV